jgi:hypothetical protein
MPASRGWRPGPLTLAAALIVLSPAPAAADWLFTPFIGLRFAGETTYVDFEDAAGLRKPILGGAAAWIAPRGLGVEADLALIPGFFQRDDAPVPLVLSSQVLTVMGNFVATVPRRWAEYSLRPYVSAGAVLMRTRIDDTSGPLVRSRVLGMNVGGGAMGFLTPRVGLRWDLRYFRNLSEEEDPGSTIGDTHLSFWRIKMGVVVRY